MAGELHRSLSLSLSSLSSPASSASRRRQPGAADPAPTLADLALPRPDWDGDDGGAGGGRRGAGGGGRGADPSTPQLLVKLIGRIGWWWCGWI
uniref:Uncharacterized protein n=1 Tax=Oryza meridionalis TaxID=40149 RepID=A0A0E0D3N4_9ORYZ